MTTMKTTSPSEAAVEAEILSWERCVQREYAAVEAEILSLERAVQREHAAVETATVWEVAPRATLAGATVWEVRTPLGALAAECRTEWSARGLANLLGGGNVRLALTVQAVASEAR